MPLPKRKTETLIFSHGNNSRTGNCRIEANGSFSIGWAFIQELRREFGIKDIEEITIKSYSGAVMRFDKLRATDNRWIIKYY